MIDIFTISGDKLFSVPILEDAVARQELMAADYVRLSWASAEGVTLPAGCYIVYDEERYSLLDPYTPERVSEVEYRYRPQFHARTEIWDKQPACIYTYEEDGVTLKSREFDWTFTGSPADAMFIVIQAIKNETGEEWTARIADSLPATVEIAAQAASIKSVLSSIAEQCETEYWMDKKQNVLHLSKCEWGETVELSVGENIRIPSVTSNDEGYYTRFYALGSTRNVKQDTSINASGIVNKRLTLDPQKYPYGYKDVKGHFEDGVFVSDLAEGEIFSKTVIFDDIYPSSDLVIADVRPRLKYRLEAGKKVVVGGTDEAPVYEQYAIWYFKIPNFEFKKEMIIEGQSLSVHFKTNQLAGRDFELQYHDSDRLESNDDDVSPFTVNAGDYEILFEEQNGMIIPGLAYIIPQDGDEVILFNIEMPIEYTESARVDLEEALDKHMAEQESDRNTYEFDSDAEAFHRDGLNVSLGQKVKYVNGDGALDTRVLMVEKHLDFTCVQRIRVGNSIIKGRSQELREEVNSLNQNVNVLSAFNDLSKSIQDNYNRTQAKLNAALAAYGEMFYWEEKGVTIGTKYNFFSEGQNAAGGIGEEEGESDGGTANIVVDTEMSDTSDNAVANKVIKAYVDSADEEIEQRLSAIESDELDAGDVVTALGYTPADANNIPTKVSQLTDAGTYAKKTDIPTKVSQLTDAHAYVTEQEFLNAYDNFTKLIPTKVSKLENDVPYLTASDIPETTVDVAMSNTSTNGVQNKVIKAYVDKAAQEVADASLRYADGREETIRKDMESDVVYLEGYAEGVVNTLEANIKADPSTYVPLKTINNLSLYGTGNISIEGGSGGGGTTGLTAINVNGESFTPENGIVTLPSYPQNVADLKDSSSYAKNTDLNSKVDKVTGKGLSTNDYTTAEKNKLARLENYDDSDIRNLINAKADPSDIPTKTSDLINDRHYITIGDVIIDDTMSETSTNAVANKVIKKYIDDADVEILKRVAALEMGDGGSDDGSSGGVAGVFKISVNGGQYVPDAEGTVILPNYPSLTGYAKISDIPTTVAELKDASDYAKQAELDAVEGTVSNQALVIASHAEELDALDKRLDTAESSVRTIQGDISSVNNKFTDDAAKKAIADGSGNNIVNTYATKTSLATTNSNVATNKSLITALQGKFTEDGKAKDAAKLGGQEPSYYASQGIVDSLSLRVTETEGDVEDIEQSIASIGSALDALNTALQKINTWYDTVGQYFDYDEKNKAWYVKGDFYATGQNAAGDAGDAVADIAALEARIAALEAKLN